MRRNSIALTRAASTHPGFRRVKAAVAVLALSAPTGLSGQQNAARVIEQIRDEATQRGQAVALYEHLTNAIGPRLTASPAFKESIDWAEARFQQWGLANVHTEPFAFGRGWTLEKLALEMTAPRYFPLTGFPEAWSPGTRGMIEGKPVYVGDRTMEQLESMRAQLRGAIVLAAPPQDRFIEEDRIQPVDTDERVRIGAPPSIRMQGPVPARELSAFLQQAGAAAMLRPSMGEHGTIFVLGNRNTQNDAVPSIVMMAEHYNMLVRMTQSNVAPTLRLQLDVRFHEEDTNAYNVLAEIPGTDPLLRDEVVMIGAHIDSWHSSPGATDNADGTAAVMEAMRILKAIGAQPRRTIRAALWGGEEQGLLGSRAWVERHLAGEANGTAREKLSVYFNDDPGTGATYGFYAEEDPAAKEILDGWLRAISSAGVRKNVIDHIGSTDHLAFTALGVPGFTAIKDYVDYDVRTHHTNVDFFERIPADDVVQSAIVMAAFAYQAAMRDQPFPRPAAR